jgi:hypothetical protein
VSAPRLPQRDPKRMTRLLSGKIETIEPGFGIEIMTRLGAVRSSGQPRRRAEALPDRARRRIRNFVGCVLHRLFCITGELFSLALRLLSQPLGFQICRACGFTGRFLDFSRGLIGAATLCCTQSCCRLAFSLVGAISMGILTGLCLSRSTIMLNQSSERAFAVVDAISMGTLTGMCLSRTLAGVLSC